MTPAFLMLLQPDEAARRIPGWPAGRRLLAVVGADDTILSGDVEGTGILDVLSWLPVHPTVPGRRGVDLDFAREASLVKAACMTASRHHPPSQDAERGMKQQPPGSEYVDPSVIATAGLVVGDLVRIDTDPSGAYVLRRPTKSRLSRIGHDLALSLAIAGAFFMGLIS